MERIKLEGRKEIAALQSKAQNVTNNNYIGCIQRRNYEKTLWIRINYY